jgi:hypothetical protein
VLNGTTVFLPPTRFLSARAEQDLEQDMEQDLDSNELVNVVVILLTLEGWKRESSYLPVSKEKAYRRLETTPGNGNK